VIKNFNGIDKRYGGAPKVHGAAAIILKDHDEYDFSSSENDEDEQCSYSAPDKVVSIQDDVVCVKNMYFLQCMNFYHHLFLYGNDFMRIESLTFRVFLTSGFNGPKW